MKAKKNWIITIVLLAIFLAVMQVTQVAGKSEQKVNTIIQEELEKFGREKNREILAGLQGVAVGVEYFKPEAEKYGFNRQQYKTDVELRLRQYGVKVFSMKERLLTSGSPYLYINVNPKFDKIGLVAVSIMVELNENVSLERNPSIMTHAATWKESIVATVGVDRVNEVRDGVKDLVDQFINDYLAANPKEQPPQQKTEK